MIFAPLFAKISSFTASLSALDPSFRGFFATKMQKRSKRVKEGYKRRYNYARIRKFRKRAHFSFIFSTIVAHLLTSFEKGGGVRQPGEILYMRKTRQISVMSLVINDIFERVLHGRVEDCKTREYEYVLG